MFVVNILYINVVVVFEKGDSDIVLPFNFHPHEAGFEVEIVVVVEPTAWSVLTHVKWQWFHYLRLLSWHGRRAPSLLPPPELVAGIVELHANGFIIFLPNWILEMLSILRDLCWFGEWVFPTVPIPLPFTLRWRTISWLLWSWSLPGMIWESCPPSASVSSAVSIYIMNHW